MTVRLFGHGFPVGTLLVNLLGCFLIGLVSELALQSELLSRQTSVVVVTGFLGGLTTFSSFAYDGVRMMDRRALALLASYVFASVVLGLGAALWGTMVARHLVSDV